MLKISTTVAALLAVLSAVPAIDGRAADKWPLRQEIDLSSGFGDYRQGHFHFGVDLRTGGRIGRSINSPVDGYIWRVRTAYTGYGKALYIKGDDDHYYIFGHLSDFSGPVDQAVKAAQLAARRYVQDMEFPEDSIRVGRGEFI
ncbi:MAG: hypothetical protein AB1744_12375, partial [Candidatus Zixiibacteriota bacterium]